MWMIAGSRVIWLLFLLEVCYVSLEISSSIELDFLLERTTFSHRAKGGGGVLALTYISNFEFLFRS